VSPNAAMRMTEVRTQPPPAFEDEEALLASVRLGDPAAIRALYDAHARGVMSNARRLGLPVEEVEDVAQEVFTAAFRDVRKIHPGSLSAFLFRLTSNRVHDRFRRRRVRETFARWFGAAVEQEAPEGPERAAIRRDAERRVGRILAAMSHKKRDVFALFELQGATGDEIAEQLGIPLDTVWTRLHHARIEFAKVARTLDLFEDARAGRRAT
jgi:RNA polymerase sigma-70 factor (ECF subfamily)